MAHTYSLVRSYIDRARQNLHTGYVSITLVDDYASGGYVIDAEDVNPNMSTLYQLTVLNQHDVMLDATVQCALSFDYADQALVAVEVSDGAANVELSDVDALTGQVLYCYYEGA